jgi:hypothetical protein
MNSLSELNNFSNSGITFNDTRSFSMSINGNAAPTGSTSRTLTVNMPSSMPLGRFVGQEPGQVTQVVGALAGSITTATGDPETVYPNPLPVGVVYQDIGTSHLFTGMSPAIFRYIAGGLCAVGSTNTRDMTYPSGNVTVAYQWNNASNVVSAGSLPLSIPDAALYDQDQQSNIAAPTVFANAAITNASMTVDAYWANSVSKITTLGTGGIVESFPESSKIVITGNTAQINSHLSTLKVTPAADYTGNIYLNYALKNNTAASVNIQGANVFYQTGQTITPNIYSLTRTYTQHGTDLLFPANVPTVPAGLPPTQSVSLQLTLSEDVGFIGRDIGDTQWNSSTLTFSNTGMLPDYTTDVNALIAQLRFFPKPNTSKSVTVRLRITNGVDTSKNVDKIFALKGTALSSLISGGTALLLASEDDVISALNPFTIRPHYTDIYSVTYRTRGNGVYNNIGVFSGSGWSGTSTLTKSFGPATSLSQYASNLAEVDDPILTLTPDVNGNFVLEQTLALRNEDVYTATKQLVVQPAGEYTAPTDANMYIYDNLGFGGYTITDAPNNVSNTYSVTLRAANAAIGSFYINGSSAGNTVVVTGTRTQVNGNLAANISYVANKNVGTNTIYFSAARLSVSPTTIVSNLAIPQAVTVPAIGTAWQGGVYVGATNDTDLGAYYRVIAPPANETTLSFKSTTSTLPYYPGETYNYFNGQTNTTTLVNKVGYGANTAAGYSDGLTVNSKSDWYLATTDELKLARDANVLTTGGTYWCSQVWEGGHGSSDPYIGGLYALPNPSWGAPIFWTNITTSTNRYVRPMRKLPR